MNSKKRLLFFDIARITAISGILLLHYCHFYNMPYNNGTPGTIWILNTGKAGNILFIIISGAMLEYTHSAIKNKKDLLAFYYNRFIRIVPAYWLSLIIGVLLFPNLIPYSDILIFEQLTASTVFINSHSPALNPPAYFIVIIGVLALLFPLVRKPVNTYPGNNPFYSAHNFNNFLDFDAAKFADSPDHGFDCTFCYELSVPCLRILLCNGYLDNANGEISSYRK